MSRICTLASSSSGNSTVICSSSTALLVDAGISCRGIIGTIKEQNLSTEALRGVLITHEHSDHIKGLAVLMKRLDVPIVASAKVLNYIKKNVVLPEGVSFLELTTKGLRLGDIDVLPFETPHDSVGSYGFRFDMPDQSKIGYATDLGSFTPAVKDGLCGCHAVVLESNYDEGMLDFGPYPRSLKDRIRGARGHLSNTDCGKAALYLANRGTARFILAHLSSHNNVPSLAYQTTVSHLLMEGLREGIDFVVEVAPKTGGKMVAF